MSHPGYIGGLATRRAVDLQVSSRVSASRRQSNKAAHQELEGRLAALQKDYADLHTAIFEAAQVHRRLCAPRLVRYEDFEIASEIFAVRHLAGDFFTIKESQGRVILALGDICGKGLAAGMWTTHLVGLVGARAAVHCEPDWIVTGVNRDVCLQASMVPLASLFIAKLDPQTGKLEYCNAGHPPALVLRANGDMELLSDGGLLLGVVPDAPYKRGCVEMQPGDVLLAYSDGVLESQNDVEEEFGSARLEAQLRRAAMKPRGPHAIQSSEDTNAADLVASQANAESVLFSVLGAVQDFASPRPLVDDMSMVIVRRGCSVSESV
jgi:serine phosphatase RsbU (regulator of sigma subunit)